MAYVPQLLTLAGVMLLACMSPGPDFIAVSSHALGSRRAGLLVAFGVACGCTVWALLAVLGFGLLLTRLGWLYSIVRLAGAGYLVFVGGKMLICARSAGEPLTVLRTTQGGRGAFRRGFLINMANPKAAAFFGSLFLTLLPATASPGVYAATVVIVGGVATGWFVALALMFSAARVRSIYDRIRRPVNVIMGAALVALGARLALAR